MMGARDVEAHIIWSHSHRQNLGWNLGIYIWELNLFLISSYFNLKKSIAMVTDMQILKCSLYNENLETNEY